MSQQSVFSKTRSPSLEQVQLENSQLQQSLSAQRLVIDSLERRAGRSLSVVDGRLTELTDALDNGAVWDVSLCAMQHEISSLCDLIADAMLLQKLEAGKVEFKLQLLDLAELVMLASSPFLEPQCSERAQLFVQIPALLPPVLADPELTEAVVTDLLARSLRYSDPGSPVVLEASRADGKVILRITAQRFAPPGDRDFATEITLCCRRVEVQNGEITCSQSADGSKIVIIGLPVA
jgi:signal transduction histidine kinase